MNVLDSAKFHLKQELRKVDKSLKQNGEYLNNKDLQMEWYALFWKLAPLLEGNAPVEEKSLLKRHVEGELK